MTLPTESDARRIAAEVCGEPVATCDRFATGLRHWVYDVVLESGRNVVVRLSHPDNRAELAGGVFWQQQLVGVGVPVAQVLAHNTEARQPYMVLQRLPGTDLGNVFDQLTVAELDGVAESVATMQRRTGELAPGTGFGYALSYGTALRPSWRAVLEGSIDRSESASSAAGVVRSDWAQRVRLKLDASKGALEAVAPTAFLHDATTKNVIVSDGQLSGIVDIDEMAFGDPLWAVALTEMSLRSARRSTHYTDRLAQLMGADDVGETRLRLYCAIFCLGFLAELGQRFNQQSAAPVDEAHQSHLESVMQGLLAD